MNAKRCGWLFLSLLLFEAAVTFLVVIFAEQISMGMIASLLFSQMIVFLPTAVFLLAAREAPGKLIAFARPKLSTSLMVIVFSYLCMPLLVMANAISMLFVDNEVMNLQGALAGVPAWQVLLVVGIVGPVNEEFVFRGVLYHGFRRSGRWASAMLLSAVLFGLTHLNFNQMSYAIVMGVIGVLLIEGTGSIFYSMLLHICINMTSAVQMALTDAGDILNAESSRQQVEQAMQMPYRQAMCVVISVVAVFACVTTALAACLFYAIVKKENRLAHMQELWHLVGTGQEKQRLFSIPLVIAIVLCLGFMIWSLCMG